MKQHQLGGQIGTDPNFTHNTHTGHSKKAAKHSAHSTISDPSGAGITT